MSVSGISDIERLVALEDIRALKSRRDRALDRKDWVAFEAAHWPEHLSEVDDEGITGRPIVETVAAMRKGLEHVDTTHHSHSPDISFTSPTEATGIWMMEDMLHWNQGDEQHWLHGYGFYHEKYEKRGDEWRVIHRWLERTHVQTTPGADLGKKVTPRRRTGIYWS